MKKILSILFIGLISIMISPFNASAKNISTLDITNDNNDLTVSGTTENGVLAIAVLVYSGDELVHMETCSNNNDKYSCKLSKAFEIGDYTVKVADYDGGDYISKNVSIKVVEDNPKTGDDIMVSILIGGISVIVLLISAVYLKKTHSN